jgi:hypothetical protein
MTISLKKEKKYIIDGETEKKVLNYEEGYTGFVIRMKQKNDWVKSEGMDYLLGFERFLNENNIDFYVYDDSYCVVGNWIEVTLVVEDENIGEFKAAYYYFKKDHKALIGGYENEAKKLENDMEKMVDDIISGQDEVNTIKEKACETCTQHIHQGFCSFFNCKLEKAKEMCCKKEYRKKKEELQDEIQEEKTFEVEKFIFAGNATFTLESTKTGNRYTYKMSKCKDKKDLYFVGLLSGPDNEKDYKYMGVVDKGNFRLTANSKIKKDATSVKAFAFFIAKLDKLNDIEGLNIYHEGTCGHCGRKLTTPESIKTGFGPVCMGLM